VLEVAVADAVGGDEQVAHGVGDAAGQRERRQHAEQHRDQADQQRREEHASELVAQAGGVDADDDGAERRAGPLHAG